MRFYVLSPEVAGGLGENTQMDTAVHPPKVAELHYQFEGWLGDDLLESFPCYIVTDGLGSKLTQANLTGFQFAPVEVTTSEQFKELYPGRQLPKFVWLKVEGKAGREDFGISKDKRLVVSEEALRVLRSFHMSNCGVADYSAN